MTDKELQQLFQARLGKREFPVNDANWRAMEAMLEARRRRKAYFKRMSRALVTFGTMVALLLLWQRPSLPAGKPGTSGVAQQYPAAVPFGKRSSRPAIYGPLTMSSTLPNAPLVYEPRRRPTKAQSTSGASSNTAHANTTVASATPARASDLPISEAPTVATASNAELPDGKNQLAPERLNGHTPPESPLHLPSKWGTLDPLPVGYALRITENLPGSLAPGIATPKYVPSPWQLSLGMALGTNNGAASRSGFHAQVDAQVSYALSSHWQVYGGIGLAHYANLGIKTRHDSVFFGFGREDVRVKTTYQKINTVEFPLGVRYQWGVHKLQVGAYAQRVLGVQENTRREVFSFKGRDFIETHRNFTQVEQINSWQYGFSAGYQRQLGNSWELALQVGLNASDLTNDQFEQLQNTFRLKRISLGLRYNFTP